MKISVEEAKHLLHTRVVNELCNHINILSVLAEGISQREGSRAEELANGFSAIVLQFADNLDKYINANEIIDGK